MPTAYDAIRALAERLNSQGHVADYRMTPPLVVEVRTPVSNRRAFQTTVTLEAGGVAAPFVTANIQGTRAQHMADIAAWALHASIVAQVAAEVARVADRLTLGDWSGQYLANRRK